MKCKQKQDAGIMKERYVNFFTDFGFKRLFGSEPTKACLIDFLNALLEGQEEPIVDLQFKKTEHLGAGALDRKAIFDVYCENEKGEKFVVELQKAKQKYFKDRSVFYSTFPIQEQAEKGDWNFRLKAVYTIGILDFEFDDDHKVNDKHEAHAEPRQYYYNVKLTDQETNKVFYDKLTFIYLEMPNFTKEIDQLETRFDKWMFAIKNLSRLDDKPVELRDAVFEAFFSAAEIAAFDPEERDSYEQSLKYYRDINNVIDTAREEGYEEGKQEATQVLQMTEAILEEERRQRESAEAREEEAKGREVEAKAREEEAKAREEEAKAREVEAKAREEETRNLALKALTDAGIPEAQARKQLGLD